VAAVDERDRSQFRRRFQEVGQLLDPAWKEKRKNIILTVVVPVYQAEKTIAALCRRLTQVLSTLTADHEIILIDDRSSDRSWEIMQELVLEYPQVISVRLSRNFGQHHSLTAGMHLSSGAWSVLMDGDLQDQPEDIPNLFKLALAGNDIVIGRRRQRRDSRLKRCSSRLFYGVFGLLSGLKIDSSVGLFRILNRTVVDAFCRMPETHRLFSGLIEWLGFKTAFCDVTHAPRGADSSTYTLKSSLKLALDGIISFSNRPLYLSIVLGTLISFLAGMYGIYLIVYYLLHGSLGTSGTLSILALNAFLGGLILMNLGVLGLYIGRTYDQTKNRPLYVIDQVAARDLGTPSPLPSSTNELPGRP